MFLGREAPAHFYPHPLPPLDLFILLPPAVSQNYLFMPGVLQRKVVLSGYSVYRRICPPQHLLHIVVDLQDYKYDEQLLTFHHIIHETVGPSVGITLALATHTRGMTLIFFTRHPTLTCTLYTDKLPDPYIYRQSAPL